MKRTAVYLCFILCTQCLYADSPITSTKFYSNYSDYPIVEKAHISGILTDTIADYILSDTIDIEVKAAIINALSWDAEGKNNAPLFMQYIVKKYNYQKGFDLNILPAEDIFCLGYLTIMDDYFETEKPIKILTLARDKSPKSFTIQMILALAISQEEMDSDWCRVYKICDEVRKNNGLTKDMKQDSIDAIFNYINLYKAGCHDKK